jgi:hypothetical protein
VGGKADRAREKGVRPSLLGDAGDHLEHGVVGPSLVGEGPSVEVSARHAEEFTKIWIGSG